MLRKLKLHRLKNLSKIAQMKSLSPLHPVFSPQTPGGLMDKIALWDGRCEIRGFYLFLGKFPGILCKGLILFLFPSPSLQVGEQDPIIPKA